MSSKNDGSSSSSTNGQQPSTSNTSKSSLKNSNASYDSGALEKDKKKVTFNLPKDHKDDKAPWHSKNKSKK